MRNQQLPLMDKLLDQQGRFTPDGLKLIRTVSAALRPIFQEFLDKGYDRNEIAQQFYQAVDFVKREHPL